MHTHRPTETEADTQVSGVWVLFAVLLATAIFRFVFSSPLYLLDDEAYYWVWSRNLSLSYFDHPPMVAWLIWLFTAVLGDAPSVIRLPAVLSILATSWIGIRLTAKIYGKGVVLWHYLAGSVISLFFFAPSIAMTPDTPVILFLALMLWFFYKAAFEDSIPSWYGAGLVFGLALLSKYTAVLWGGSLFLFLLLRPELRRHLLTPHPWLAMLAALLVFSPVLIWNAQNDWASFRFQLGHGLPSGKQGDVLQYLGSQAALTTPGVLLVMFGLCLGALQHWRTTRAQIQMLVISALLPLLFFLYAATKAPVSANWPAFAYFTGLILVAGWHAEADSGWRRAVKWLNYAAMTSLVILLMVQTYFKWPVEKEVFTDRYYGWPDILDQVETWSQRYPDATVIGDIYQVQSQLAYRFGASHLPALGVESRRSHYQYMDGSALLGKNLLLVDRAYSGEEFTPYFDSITHVATLWGWRDGRKVRRMELYYAKNYWPHPGQSGR